LGIGVYEKQIWDSVLTLRWVLRKGGCSHDCASGVFAGIDGVMDTKRYLLDLHSGAGQVSSDMVARQKFKSQLIELLRYVLRKLSRRHESVVPSVYVAFSIGPEEHAIGVYELGIQNDEDALRKATLLFHDGLKRIEVWCGSRKVGDVPAKADKQSDGEPVRDSA
jgi:hypothetical protein